MHLQKSNIIWNTFLITWLILLSVGIVYSIYNSERVGTKAVIQYLENRVIELERKNNQLLGRIWELQGLLEK